MITLSEYFGKFLGHADETVEVLNNAVALLKKVNALLDQAEAAGIAVLRNPATKTQISGMTFGGFRPRSCDIGAPNSSHKQGRGVDVYDLRNGLDNWLTDSLLESFDLYREDPAATPNWCHLTDRAPASGNRTFTP